MAKVVQELGRLDILVNNASEQHMAAELTDITPEELQRTFETNIFSYFYFAQVRLLCGCGCSVVLVRGRYRPAGSPRPPVCPNAAHMPAYDCSTCPHSRWLLFGGFQGFKTGCCALAVHRRCCVCVCFAVQAALPHLKEGSSILNTASINAYKGNASLIPYTATKGAEVGLHDLRLLLVLSDSQVCGQACCKVQAW